MKKRSARPGDRRDHERRFSERQTARGEDDDDLATREGRPVRLPLAAETSEEVVEEVQGNALAEGQARRPPAARCDFRDVLFWSISGVLARISGRGSRSAVPTASPPGTHAEGGGANTRAYFGRRPPPGRGSARRFQAPKSGHWEFFFHLRTRGFRV